MLSFCVFFLALSNILVAQGPSNPIDFENIDVNTMREHIYAGIPQLYKEKRWARKTYDFSHSVACGIEGLVTSGQIMHEWPQLETYLNKVMRSVMPEELKKDSIIHAYIIADGAYNAFMTPTGMMFINIGLITALEDEASLASVLAHELGHYYKQHSLKKFIKQEKGDFRVTLLKDASANMFSIDNEYQSDSLSMLWMQNAGYSLKGMEKSMKIMMRLSDKRVALSKDKWEFKETTHPSSDKRLLRLQEYLRNNPENDNVKNFLVDESGFNQLKEQCKKEVLSSLLAHYKYSACIEKAFKYHLLDPNNTTYIYYLLEGIRRKCYLDYTLWDENFITHRYYKSIERDNGSKYKEKMSHLFSNIYKEVMDISGDEARKIKAGFYWQGEPKFITYEQAFIFFNRIAEAVELDEAILTNALSMSHNKEAMNKLLEKYLSKPNIKYRAYAEAILNNTSFSKLKNKKVAILDDFQLIVKQGKDYIPIIASVSNKEQIKQWCDSIIQNQEEESTIISLHDLKHTDIKEYKNLLLLEEFAFLPILTRGKPELHMLNPDFWDYFRKYGTNEMIFINLMCMEFRSAERSIEAYQSMVNSDVIDIISQPKRSRSLQLSFLSLRMKDNSRMKVRYGYEYDMSFKTEGDKEIRLLFKEHLAEKDVYYKEMDRRYRASLD